MSHPAPVVSDSHSIPGGAIAGSKAPVARSGFDESKFNSSFATDHLLGSKAASTTLVVYSDFQCPYCIRDYSIVKAFVEQSNGTVNMIIRHFPLDIHAQAKPMANASECIAEQAGDRGFWQFADSVFVSGKFDYSSGALLEPIVAKFKINDAQFDDCLKTRKFEHKIDANYAEGNAVGVSGTPSMVVYNNI